MTICASCKVPIRVIPTIMGWRVTLDAGAVPGGEYVIEQRGKQAIAHRWEGLNEGKRYQRHECRQASGAESEETP